MKKRSWPSYWSYSINIANFQSTFFILFV